MAMCIPRDVWCIIFRYLFDYDYVQPNRGLYNPLQVCKEWYNMIKSSVLDPTLGTQEAMVYACERGKVDFLKALLADKRMDPVMGNNFPLLHALNNRKWDCVMELIKDPRVNLGEKYNIVFIAACREARCEIVSTMLKDPRLDLSDGAFGGNNSNDLYVVQECLHYQISCGRTEMVGILSSDTRIKVDPERVLLTYDPHRFQCVKMLFDSGRISQRDIDNAIEYADAHDMRELLNDLQQMQIIMLASMIPMDVLKIIFRFMIDNNLRQPNRYLFEPLRVCKRWYEVITKEILDPSLRYCTSIVYAAKNNKVESVKKLLCDDRINDKLSIVHALECALQVPNWECVDLLMRDSRVILHQNGDFIFRLACKYKKTEIISYMLDVVSKELIVSTNENRWEIYRLSSHYIYFAIINDCTDIALKILGDPRFDVNIDSLIEAIKRNNIAVVDALLRDDRIKPSEKSNRALQLAHKYGRKEILRLLADSDKLNVKSKKNKRLVAMHRTKDDEPPSKDQRR